MNKQIGFIFFILLCFAGLSGQINPFGVPEIINYPPGITKGSEQNWAAVQDNRGIMYFGNDEKGVLEYDGNEWRTISIPNKSIVRSLACGDDGTIYVGAVSEFGYLAPDSSGLLEYKSLTPKLDSVTKKFANVWKTFCTKDKVYFHTQNYIFTYFPDLDSLQSYHPEIYMLFGFYANDKYYIGTFEEGLSIFQDDSLVVNIKGGDYYKHKNIFGLISYDKNHLLIGAENNGLSIYNTETGQVDKSFASKRTNDYLNENFLTHLLKLADGDIAASTMGGGIAIINRDGDITEIISDKEGLQNQMVYSAFQSPHDAANMHLWVALSLGIGKINIESPIRNFTEQTGYHGLIHTINSIDDRIFIGTASGLYASTVVDNFSSFEKIGTVTRPVWDLEKYTLNTGEKILLAIGDDGLMQVKKNGELLNLENRIRGVEDESERVFWGYSIFKDPFKGNRIIIGSVSSITSLIYENGNWFQELSAYPLPDEVRSIAVSNNNKLWFGMKLGGIGCIPTFNDFRTINYYSIEHGLPSKENNTVNQFGDDILVGTSDGIYRIYDSPDTIYFYKDTILNKYLPAGKNAIMNIYKDPASALWISFENKQRGWSICGLEPMDGNKYNVISKPFYSLGDFSTDAFYSIKGTDVWLSKSNLLYNYTKDSKVNEDKYPALIRKVTVDDDSEIFNGTFSRVNKHGKIIPVAKQDPNRIPNIKYSNNNIQFRWSAPYFEHEESLEFSYFLDGFSKNWSEWEREFYHDFTNLPLGEYTFKIKARNIFNTESLEDSYSFIILRPWYLTFVALLLYIVAAVLFVYMIIALYTRRLKNENIRLEGIIQDRTAEIRKQKEELTDSIEYASRIQRALLPPDHMLAKHNLEHFILFKPRDIVSGDFYWFGSNEKKIFIVAADCTGHGVPGAFMSMLGISFLDEIVIKSGVSDTNLVLDALRNHVITSLRQTGKSMEESTKDGMDLAMVAIDKETRSVQYSGAYNPLYIARELNKEEKSSIAAGKELELERGYLFNETHILYQIKADLMPIGISEKNQAFVANTVIDPDANIYLFSDGFVDQFGGPSGKKFMSKNFKKLLLDIQNLPMEKQGKKLDDTLLDWMQDISQIDDILVIGLKLGNK